MYSVLILAIGRDSLLLKLREQVLIKLGYLVKTASDLPDFYLQFSQGDYDLVILCHTLSATEAKGIINFARNHRPSARLLGLSPVPAETFRLYDAISSPDPVALHSCIQDVMTTARSGAASAAHAHSQWLLKKDL